MNEIFVFFSSFYDIIRKQIIKCKHLKLSMSAYINVLTELNFLVLWNMNVLFVDTYSGSQTGTCLSDLKFVAVSAGNKMIKFNPIWHKVCLIKGPYHYFLNILTDVMCLYGHMFAQVYYLVVTVLRWAEWCGTCVSCVFAYSDKNVFLTCPLLLIVFVSWKVSSVSLSFCDKV